MPKLPHLTKDDIATISLYRALMEEVKIRIASINFAVSGQMRCPGPVIEEFCYLQLRLMCELIALGCLVAHGDIQATQTGRLRKEWQADKILLALEGLHPDYYPIPTKEVQEGGKIFLVLLTANEAGFLRKNDLLDLYGKCGNHLHKGNLKKLLSPRTPVQTQF